MQNYGIQGQAAPELRAPEWLENTDGDLKLADIVAPLMYESLGVVGFRGGSAFG